ncbi:DoxX family protein, partial [Actinosynnema sp. NPDC023658]|uniref:DoxX family protein n=1 Tax=Actinosynnema sp. NPDC023658 TaxID=3155465 RepID=UPI0033D407BD
MATHDDRSKASSGYSDDGFYSTSGVGGGVHHFDDGTRTIHNDAFTKDTSAFDTTGYTPVADLDDKPATHYDTLDDDEERRPFGWTAGPDIGLLVLRLALGGAFVVHGLQKVFGLFGGPGIDGFAQYLQSAGFREARILAWVTGVTELAGGGLLVLGLC